MHVKKGTTLDVNFVSRETYVDVLTSCHFATSFILLCRDSFPDIECHLEETGTDCCETYFSRLGQWVGNKHNYTYADMIRNSEHCSRLEEIRTTPGGPKFAKSHPKSESIWDKQYGKEYNPVNLKNYPLVGEELESWKKGILIAWNLASSLGMSPSNTTAINIASPFNETNPDTWFYHPFHLKGNSFQSHSECPVDRDPLDDVSSPESIDESDIDMDIESKCDVEYFFNVI